MNLTLNGFLFEDMSTASILHASLNRGTSGEGVKVFGKETTCSITADTKYWTESRILKTPSFSYIACKSMNLFIAPAAVFLTETKPS